MNALAKSDGIAEIFSGGAREFQFSVEGATELADFHKRVLESLKIALAVFMSGDVAQARQVDSASSVDLASVFQ